MSSANVTHVKGKGSDFPLQLHDDCPHGCDVGLPDHPLHVEQAQVLCSTAAVQCEKQMWYPIQKCSGEHSECAF